MALEKILAHKTKSLVSRKTERPLDTLKKDLKPSDRSLKDALVNPRTGFILECKKASPSKGLIRENYDVFRIAKAYEPYADAVSVLTDAEFFAGSFEDLQSAREAVQVPVLCKDFILEPYQIFEARWYGADAVLLMLSVLDDDAYRECARTAEKLDMDAVVEVHNEEEMERALNLGAGIIGINNRNLVTLDVDLAVTERLEPIVPVDRIVISESGILSHDDVRRLGPRVDAFLVGTRLMQAPDVGQACRELIYGRVKVCGLTSVADAMSAVRCGAVFGGLIFVEQSPRKVTEEQAAEITKSVDLKWVGVFSDHIPRIVSETAHQLKLSAVQLHGDEDADYINALRSMLPDGCEIWKSHRVKDSIPSVEETGADRLLLDTYVPDVKGGTGKKFDWKLLNGLDLSRVILGGGLDHKSVSKAMKYSPWALDVNSGVEKAPGVKSRPMLDRFFSKIRGNGRSH